MKFRLLAAMEEGEILTTRMLTKDNRRFDHRSSSQKSWKSMENE